MLNDDTPEGIEAFNKTLDLMLSDMVDRGIISMGWDDKKESIVYFFTPAQRKDAEDPLGNLNQYLPEEGSDD